MDADYEQKWKVLEAASKEIEELEQSEEAAEDLTNLSDMKEKINKLIMLRDKLGESEEKTQMQQAILLRERNLYLEKWRMIEQLGQDNDWEDESMLLNSIKELIENISKAPGEK